MDALIDMEVKIEGEAVLYANRYNKYAVTESPSNQGGKELTVYWIEGAPVELFRIWYADLGELLPTMTEFVARERAEDEKP